MIRLPLKIGDIVCDMHYGGRIIAHKELHEKFLHRNVIEFPLSDADAPHVESPRHQPQSRHLEAWLDKLSRDAGHGPYTNKYLIVVAEKSSDGWTRVAYMYDGRRFGMCEIKAHADHLHEALTK